VTLIDALRRRNLTRPPFAAGIRRAAGATQDDVAAALGVGRVTVARWEAGVRHPRGKLLDRYAALLEELAVGGACTVTLDEMPQP
jgi:transcriptional regulator with XRE-family HTH domain